MFWPGAPRAKKARLRSNSSNLSGRPSACLVSACREFVRRPGLSSLPCAFMLLNRQRHYVASMKSQPDSQVRNGRQEIQEENCPSCGCCCVLSLLYRLLPAFEFSMVHVGSRGGASGLAWYRCGHIGTQRRCSTAAGGCAPKNPEAEQVSANYFRSDSNRRIRTCIFRASSARQRSSIRKRRTCRHVGSGRDTSRAGSHCCSPSVGPQTKTYRISNGTAP
jgi:hypothetical protein